MENKNQELLKLPIVEDYKVESLIKSDCNEIAINLIENWPKWPDSSRFACVFGPKGCGKTHISNVWSCKTKAKTFKSISEKDLFKINQMETSFVFENVKPNNDWPENLLFQFINELKETNSFLLMTSSVSPNSLNWHLPDLISRLASFTSISIESPDDDLIRKLISKHFLDRQLSPSEEVVEYILRRIERSFIAITEIVNSIDSLSLKLKKPITLSLVKEAISIRNG